jgi:hypothetical protein
MIASALSVPLLIACARTSDRPPEPSPAVVVPHAPQGAPSEDLAEAQLEREPPSSERQKPARRDPADSREPLRIEVAGDGGGFSFSARTVRDGGFSFQLSGSVSLSSDGGAISVTISPDAGAP